MKLHCISGYISTLFLCEYSSFGGECLLLDTGMPTDFDRMRFYIENVLKPRGGPTEDGETPLRMEDVLKTVVSSHCHIDHVGAAWAYNDAGIKVATADGFERYYAGFGGRCQHAIDTALSLVFAHRLGRHLEWPIAPLRSTKQLDPNLRLRDGSRVPSFSDWAVIACPGHTCHMNMLYHPELHLLYAADFFVAHKNEFRAPVPVDVDWAYESTLRRLSKLRVRYVALAHGGLIDCEDMGGWEQILREVAEHRLKEDRNLGMRFIRRFLIGFSNEPKMFDRSMLPRGPLPEPFESAPVMTMLD